MACSTGDTHIPPSAYESDHKRAWEDFHKKLRSFPHHFQLENYRNIARTQLQNIRDRLQRERKDKNDDQNYMRMGRSRDSNFIAFISFILGDADKALKETERVLVEDPNNVVTLANKATFLWLNGDKMGADLVLDILAKVTRNEDASEKMIDATAEMAYCYSRMGISYVRQAVQLFEEVVQQRPEEHDWKLGLAMMLRRFSVKNVRIYHRVSKEDLQSKILKAVWLLTEVKANASVELKAHAATELGKLLLFKFDDPELSEAVKGSCHGLTAVECVQEAMELDPQNPAVLIFAGRFFRDHNMLQDSLRTLERALRVRETIVVYCSLGRTYSARVKEKRCQPNFLPTDDKDVRLGITCYKKALEIAYGEAPFAHYHLGLLYKDIQDYERALTEFLSVPNYQKSKECPIENANAYKHCGLIKLRLSKQEEDPDRKRELHTEGLKYLNFALSQMCRTFPTCRERSFQALIAAAKNRASPSDQLEEEARLFHMMRNHQKTLGVLDKLSKVKPKQFQDAEFIEMRLECYIKEKKFEDAVFFVSLLSVTKERDRTELWKNPSLPLQTYILAASEKLLLAGRSDGYDLDYDMARKYFRWAFEFKYPCLISDTQSIEGGDEDVDENEGDWHVLIMHDLGGEVKSRQVKAILQDTYGLRVTCMSDDVHPGEIEIFGVTNNVEKARLVVVVVESETLSHEFCQGYLGPALSARFAEDCIYRELVVIAADTSGSEGPKELRSYRRGRCPPELLVAEQPGARSKEHLKDICDLFCTLVDTTIDLKQLR